MHTFCIFAHLLDTKRHSSKKTKCYYVKSESSHLLNLKRKKMNTYLLIRLNYLAL